MYVFILRDFDSGKENVLDTSKTEMISEETEVCENYMNCVIGYLPSYHHTHL